MAPAAADQVETRKLKPSRRSGILLDRTDGRERGVVVISSAVALLALSSAVLVVNLGFAEPERALVTLASMILFGLGSYGLWAGRFALARRRR